jgi:hypothetical protein
MRYYFSISKGDMHNDFEIVILLTRALECFFHYCALVAPWFVYKYTFWRISSLSTYATLSGDTLWSLPRPGDDFNIHHGALLAPILIPRVPSTAGSDAVLNHFVNFFRSSLPD